MHAKKPHPLQLDELLELTMDWDCVDVAKEFALGNSMEYINVGIEIEYLCGREFVYSRTSTNFSKKRCEKIYLLSSSNLFDWVLIQLISFSPIALAGIDTNNLSTSSIAAQ